MKVERRRRARIGTAKFTVTAVTDGDVLQSSIDNQIDQRRRRENAVGNDVAAEPIKYPADQRTDDDNGQADSWIEVLPDVEVSAVADWTSIDRRVTANRSRKRQRNIAAAAAALDGGRRVRGAQRKTRVTLGTADDNVHLVIWSSGHLVIWSSGHLVIDWKIEQSNEQMTR